MLIVKSSRRSESIEIQHVDVCVGRPRNPRSRDLSVVVVSLSHRPEPGPLRVAAGYGGGRLVVGQSLELGDGEGAVKVLESGHGGGQGTVGLLPRVANVGVQL